MAKKKALEIAKEQGLVANHHCQVYFPSPGVSVLNSASIEGLNKIAKKFEEAVDVRWTNSFRIEDGIFHAPRVVIERGRWSHDYHLVPSSSHWSIANYLNASFLNAYNFGYDDKQLVNLFRRGFDMIGLKWLKWPDQGIGVEAYNKFDEKEYGLLVRQIEKTERRLGKRG